MLEIYEGLLVFLCGNPVTCSFFLGGRGGGRETREGLRMEESCSVTVTKGSIPRFERKPSEAASDLSKVVEKNGQKQLLGP